ncbi:MAG: substrate-binding domain-containing protein [Phycisphaerae bacterium]|nr:substrate-binding domain-containing protein [Phycisphaerae bacterium]
MAASYIEIKNSILERIATGELKPGMRVGPIRALRREFSTTLVTVDRALRELVMDRILEHKPHCGFNVATQPAPRKGFVYVFVPTCNASTLYPELVEGAEQIARCQGYQVCLVCTNDNVEQAIQAAALAVNEDIRGVIYCVSDHGTAVSRNSEAIRQFRDHDIPIVTAGHFRLPDVDILPGVASNHEDGGYVMTNHLIGLGYRRIAVLGEQPNQDIEAVLDGYRRAMSDHRLPIEAGWTRFYEPPRSAVVEVKQFFHSKKPPEAIFALGDAVAAESMLGLAEIGLSVPEDVAIVGFGDFPISRFAATPLTTMRARFREIGELACGMLLDMIEGSGDATRRIELQCELVVRRSCGAYHKSRRMP